jgi:hypothetical protein
LIPRLTLLIALCSCCAAQTWSGVLASTRAIDWTKSGLPATFPDGETTTNPWTPPTRTQSGSTVNPTGVAATDLSNINTAISNCTDGHYILLGAGTFVIQGTIIAYGHECTLRGSGAQATIIHMSSAGIIWMGSAGTGGSCTLTNNGANFTVGTTTLICNGLSGGAPAVGNIISLNQCDTGFSGNPCSGTSADNGGIFVCSFQTTCMTEPSGSGNNNSQFQNFVVTSVSNASGTYTIGLNVPLYMPNWSFSQTARLNWNNPPQNGIGIGIEDMTIYYTGTSSVNWSIQMQNTYASWVKGVRFVGAPLTDPMSTQSSQSGLVSNNYIFSDVALDGNYPGSLHTDTNSNLLVLNNIFTYGNWESDGGDTALIFAYNYMFDFFTSYQLNATYPHHAYNSFNLMEGNQLGELYEDDTWGTHDLDSYFRNYATCSDTPYTTYNQTNNPLAVAIDGYQRFVNVVGNVLGSSVCGTYQGGNSATAVIYRVNTSDTLAGSTLMRWGNVSVVTQSSDTPANSGVRFVSTEVPSSLASPNVALSNPVPGNNNLPASFFLPTTSHPSGGTGLSWWKVCKTWSTFPSSCSSYQTQPFPTSGPDVTSGAYVSGYAYDIPASVAWQNLPIDTAYQNSYTITSSSWSGGVETLTVSGLPNITHLMGPFQLSGVNAACSTGATFGANSEILMMGSTSTTVQYALSGNPGLSCTGTMKFPDVRQFDESVYQTDSSASASGSSYSGAMTIGGKVTI